jgi:hypothetical protein
MIGARRTTVEGQLGYVGYSLLNSYDGIGRELSKAQTYDQAKEAVEPYVKLLSEPVRWLTPEEAKAMGYQDEGNPGVKREDKRSGRLLRKAEAEQKERWARLRKFRKAAQGIEARQAYPQEQSQ